MHYFLAVCSDPLQDRTALQKARMIHTALRLHNAVVSEEVSVPLSSDPARYAEAEETN